MSFVQDISFLIFGKRTTRKPNYKLQKKLRQSHIGIPQDKYLAIALFVSIIIGLLGGILGYFLIGFLIEVDLPFIMIRYNEGSFLETLIFNKELIFTIALVPIFIFLFSWIIYRLFLFYPSFNASIREGQIDVALSNSVTFMYALSKGGTNLLEIFRSLYIHSDIYGEMGKEAGMIVRNVEYFGQDLTTAIHNVSDLTPSDKLKSFLEGMVSSIDAGGNITTYLQARSDQFQKEAVQEQKEFLDIIAIIAESYVTAFVAGPLFLITIIVLMGMITTTQTRLLQVIIYGVIPLGSALFVIILNMISIQSHEEHGFYTTSKEVEVFKDAPSLIPKKSESSQFIALDRYHKRAELMKFLKNPLKSFFEAPESVLYLSVPAGLIYFAMMYFFNPLGVEYIIDFDVVIATLIALIPFAIFYEIREKRLKKIENSVPDFLSGLASIQEAGLTLQKAIKLILSSNLGVLTSEVRKIWRDIQWGSTTTMAFIRFERRVKTGFISRTVNLITKASEVSGDIRDVLNIAARDAMTTKNLRQERRGTMLMYTVVVYISFAVFLFIILILTVMFLGNVPSLDISASSGTGISTSSIEIELYKRIFFHAALVQGFCSGLIAGQMGEGFVLNGVKHSIIMLLIAFFVFFIVIFH